MFRSELNKASGKSEYSVVALFPKGTDLSALEALAKEVAIEEWGPDVSKWPTPRRNPFRDQGEKAKKDDATGKMVLPGGYEAGCVFINLKSAQRPGLVDEKVQDIIDETQFYAGCWARASVHAYAYNHTGNAGIAFGLNNVQKMKDGDPLSGRTKAADDFAPIEALAGEGTPKSSSSIFG